MRTLFENWEERNKFLAKRFFIRKWFMQVKKLKERKKEINSLLKDSLPENGICKLRNLKKEMLHSTKL